MRIFAMYEGTRIMLVICSLLVICEGMVLGFICGLPSHATIGKALAPFSLGTMSNSRSVDDNSPARGVYICADSDSPGNHWVAYLWTTILVAEGVLVCFSLYKWWQNSMSEYGSSVLRELTRDSVLYFVMCVSLISVLPTMLMRLAAYFGSISSTRSYG